MQFLPCLAPLKSLPPYAQKDKLHLDAAGIKPRTSSTTSIHSIHNTVATLIKFKWQVLMKKDLVAAGFKRRTFWSWGDSADQWATTKWAEKLHLVIPSRTRNIYVFCQYTISVYKCWERRHAFLLHLKPMPFEAVSSEIYTGSFWVFSYNDSISAIK